MQLDRIAAADRAASDDARSPSAVAEHCGKATGSKRLLHASAWMASASQLEHRFADFEHSVTCDLQIEASYAQVPACSREVDGATEQAESESSRRRPVDSRRPRVPVRTWEGRGARSSPKCSLCLQSCTDSPLCPDHFGKSSSTSTTRIE